MRRNAILFAVIKVALLCLVVMSVVGGGVLFWFIPHQVSTPEVVVPNLIGQSYQQAVWLINRSGLAVNPVPEKQPSPDLPEGYVIAQEPPANFRVKLDKPIRLTLSSGSEKIAVPDVVGKHLSDAEALLKTAGFRRGRVAAVHANRYPEVNTVIAQTPQANTMHPHDGAIHLLLSLGTRSSVLRLPDLRGIPINMVRPLLESHGLKIGEETYQPHPEIDQGLIINHEPPAGGLIRIGQQVNLEISASRRKVEDKVGYLDIKYQVSPTGAPYKRVRILVEDERRKPIEVVNQFYRSGTVVERLPVRVVGKATLYIYEDGVLIKTKGAGR